MFNTLGNNQQLRVIRPVRTFVLIDKHNGKFLVNKDSPNGDIYE